MKNGATASTMWCSGSNQATCSGAPAASSATSRKRTKAFILCMSWRTACAHCCAQPHLCVERVVAQRRLELQPPEQPVQQVEAAGVAVQHDVAAQLDESRPAPAAPAAARRAAPASRTAASSPNRSSAGRGIAGDAPLHALGIDPQREQPPRGSAKAGQVGRARQLNAASSNRPRWRGAAVAAASAASIARPGRWSASSTKGSTLASGDAQPAQVGAAQPAAAPRDQQPLDALQAEPGHTQQHFARRPVQVDRKALAVRERPGVLGVDLERRACRRRRGAISSWPKP